MPNPFAHIELSTDDLKKSKKFYQSLFAWKLSDMPQMAYTMIDVGGGVGGGMQKKQMPGAPTAWLPYVKVDDVKATMAKAVKAGANAMLPFQEVGNMGAIGIFVDPSGAALGLWEEKKSEAAPPSASKAPAPKKAAKKEAAKKSAEPEPEPEPMAAPSKAAKKAPVKKPPAPAPAPPPAPAKKAPKKAAAAPPPPPAPAPAKKPPAKKK